ncbi:MAG: Pirin domain protein [Frankiales bacterium]|nr:Pirin domain protein [Frankiales bacterium]
MSNRDPAPDPPVVTAGTTGGPAHEVLMSRSFAVGDGTMVRRLLPQRRLRTIGAWCFADHYGPDDVVDNAGMVVPPHPHTGLQTVSWLLEGEIVHRDSLGTTQRVGPRELSLMTSGRGIAHSEVSPEDRPPLLFGVQLWVALPDEARHGEASYEHHTDLPVVRYGPLTATVVLGEHEGTASPGTTFSRLVGLDVHVDGDGILPLDPEFEHAVFVIDGHATIDGDPADVGSLVHVGTGQDALQLSGEDSRVMVLGGEPLGEPLVLWWNFVCRTGEEVAQAREDWAQESDRFGKVEGYHGLRLEAPPLGPARLLPRS